MPPASDEVAAAQVAPSEELPAAEQPAVDLPPDLVEPAAATTDDLGTQEEVSSPYARKPVVPDEPEDDEIPPVPPFLAGRSASEPPLASSAAQSPTASEVPTAPADDFGRAGVTEPLPQQVEIPPPLPRSSTPPAIPSEKVVRDDVVPSWEIDGRFGAQPEPEPSEDRYGGWLTAIAVVAILALGVAGVIFLPGLLAGGPARSPTPAITLLPSLAPTGSSIAATSTPSAALPTVSATPIETDGPTAEPTPEVTPRLYRIRAGDSLARIARRFDTTVEDILAANPDIENPNQIQVGQFIVIPQPPPTAAP
jgi:LysM repeat protein